MSELKRYFSTATVRWSTVRSFVPARMCRHVPEFGITLDLDEVFKRFKGVKLYGDHRYH